MSTPAPLPWTVYHDGRSVCDANGHLFTVEGESEAEEKATAEFIVRACNVHAALVAALTMARAQVELRKEDSRAAGNPYLSGFDAKLAQIDAALEAARVKS